MMASAMYLPWRSRRITGFTLIELLVACVILAILVSLFSQLASSIVTSYQSGKSQSESNAIGRALLDAMDKDIKQMIIHPNLVLLEQTDGDSVSAIKFYTRRPGIFHGSSPSQLGLGSSRNASVVEYVLYRNSEKKGYLARRDRAATWSNSSQIIPVGNTEQIATLSEESEELRLSPGILGFDWRFLRADGSIDKNSESDKPLAAIRISLAVVDDDAFRLLNEIGKLSAMMELFSQTPTSDSSGVYQWATRLDQAVDQFPPRSVQGVRFYERFIKVPQSHAL